MDYIYDKYLWGVLAWTWPDAGLFTGLVQGPQADAGLIWQINVVT